MRFVVLGTGLLGEALAHLLSERRVPHVSLDHAAIDAAGGIAKAAAGAMRAGDVVVNAAAITGVDWCEDHRAEAMEVNGEQPGHLARACAAAGAHLVHVSTDTVLDVTNVYAESKALGEARVKEAVGDDALILRISTVFGPHARRTDFVRFVVNTLRQKGEATAITDMICSPTYTLDAARAIAAAAQDKLRGTHAFVNEPSISRYDFARAIQATWGAPGVVKGVRMDEFPFKARRPRDTTMHATLGSVYTPMTLQACLDDYRARWP